MIQISFFEISGQPYFFIESNHVVRILRNDGFQRHDPFLFGRFAVSDKIHGLAQEFGVFVDERKAASFLEFVSLKLIALKLAR
jgi:hypothetical protein